MRSISSNIWKKGQKATLPIATKDKPKYVSRGGRATFTTNLPVEIVCAIQEEFPNLSIGKALEVIANDRYKFPNEIS